MRSSFYSRDCQLHHYLLLKEFKYSEAISLVEGEDLSDGGDAS